MRFRLAAVAALLAAAPAAADPPKPAVVVRAQPVSRLLADYKEMVRQVGGPVLGDGLVKKFEGELKDLLGDKGLDGLDPNRPLAAYVVLGEKDDDARLVVVVPFTGEKEFVELLGRAEIKAEPVKDKKGVYALELPDEVFPRASHLQFAGGWAYLTLNDGDPTDAKNLVPVGELVGPTDALVAANVYPGRFPEKLVGGWLDEVDNTANMIKGFLAGGPPAEVKMMTAWFEQGPKLLRRYAETAVKEAAEVELKFSWDPATGDTFADARVVPKPGTGLAKDIAARPATASRFAGLIPRDAAGGVLVKAPVFARELQEILALTIEAAADEIRREELKDVPDKLKEVVDEVAKGLARTAKTGQMDTAVALLGPDAGGKFTVVAGLSFADPAAVEAALRAVAKDPLAGKLFEFDAARAGGVGVHKVPLGLLFAKNADEFARVFGEAAPGYVAFAKDAVFAGYGPGALDGVKAALEAKPGPAPAVEVVGNAKRFQKFLAAVDEKVGAEFPKHLGADDTLVTALRVTVEGGNELRVRAAVNVRYLPKLIVVADAAEPGR